ncbi:hypothetical protein BSKO_00508 [Bryopsis sp. KO-2023]|nr:hypothetical protein BSKO_00508 [Bryopsis sp. KO-2023]
MVRYHWHVEDGYGCLVPPGQITCNQEIGVLHAAVEFEIPGQAGPVQALITAPFDYLVATKDVGVALAHGQNAEEWKGKLMTDVAVALAREGYVVVRYYCKQKEQRRQRIFEKALDACATSPFARHVLRWVLAGVGNGARVAAAVGTRCRGTMAGFILMSYPLKDPMPSNKGGPAPDSRAPLKKLESPILFITGSRDKYCSLEDLKELEPDMPSEDKRLIRMQDLDQNFKTLSGKGPLPAAISNLCSACLEFMYAINSSDFRPCLVPHLSKVECDPDTPWPPPASPPLGKPQLSTPPPASTLPAPPRPRVLPPPPQSSNMLAVGGRGVPRPALPVRLPGHPHIPTRRYPFNAFGQPIPAFDKKTLEAELLANESLDDIGLSPQVGLSLEVRGVGASGLDGVAAGQSGGGGGDVDRNVRFGWPVRENPGLQDELRNGQLLTLSQQDRHERDGLGVHPIGKLESKLRDTSRPLSGSKP